jgi:hypothetical protein
LRGDWGYQFRNDERSITFQGEFGSSVGKREILSFQPYTLSLFEIADRWCLRGCGFIEGEDCHEAILLELFNVIFRLLIGSWRDLIRGKRGFPA